MTLSNPTEIPPMEGTDAADRARQQAVVDSAINITPAIAMKAIIVDVVFDISEFHIQGLTVYSHHDAKIVF